MQVHKLFAKRPGEASAMWEVAAVPGLWLRKDSHHEAWRVEVDGQLGLFCEPSQRFDVSRRLSGQCFATRREALAAVEATLLLLQAADS